MEFVERIEANGRLLCLIVRAPDNLPETTFVTSDDFNLQVGFVVYAAGTEVPRHFHKKVVREVTGTSEVIGVRQGACSVQIYDDAKRVVAERDLAEGDIVILVDGGHGFKMQEDTVLTEVKQGPYFGDDEKVKF